MKQRPTTFLPELQKLLSSRPPRVAAAVRQAVNDVRPCVRLETRRTLNTPLRGRLIDRVLSRPPPSPSLPVTASKFGGVAYLEKPSELAGGRFIGQVNFAEAYEALAKEEFPIPQGMPHWGLLAVDLTPGTFNGRVRWYPEPNENKAVQTTRADAIAKYEASIRFVGSWSLRGLDWFDAVPKDDDELWDYMNDLEIPGVDEDARGGHKLFGHSNEVLNEHYGLSPAPGRSTSIRDYTLVWRIDYDNAAGFAWGTNWLYVVIHTDDLKAAAFERAVVTGANA